MEIINELRKIRENKKISRKEVAQKLCKSEATYRDIEYGIIRLSLEDYLIICNILEISPMELLLSNTNEHFVLLENKDIEDLNRILNKINVQTNNQNINIQTNNGSITFNNGNSKEK